MKMKKAARDEFGLIEGVKYKFDESGNVDWRKMISNEFLVPNSQYFEKKQQITPTSIEGLADNQLLILLGGIKELAALRGFSDVRYDITAPLPEYVCSVCRITWIPNFETFGDSVTFSSVGDASFKNTNNFGQLFLGAIAENRSFVRCVRNFLRINILSQEEMAPKIQNKDNRSDGEPGYEPHLVLENLMKKKNISFEMVKTKLTAEGIDGANRFTSIKDLPRIKVFELIERLNSKKTN